MCWGFRPTLAFVLAELVVLAALCARGARNDRLNALLHVPLVLQEVLQLALWAALSAEDRGSAAAPRGCSGVNAALSLAEMAVVGAVPAWFALYAALGQPASPAGRQLRELLWHWAVFCLGVAAAAVALFAATLHLGWSPRCTAVGPWGHQIWPHVVVRPPVLRAVYLLLYQGMLATSLVSVRHATLAPALLLGAGPLPVALYVVVGDEWGSVWCFIASLMCAAYLVEPAILDRWLREPGPRMGGLLLLGTRAGDSDEEGCGSGGGGGGGGGSAAAAVAGVLGSGRALLRLSGFLRGEARGQPAPGHGLASVVGRRGAPCEEEGDSEGRALTSLA